MAFIEKTKKMTNMVRGKYRQVRFILRYTERLNLYKDLKVINCDLFNVSSLNWLLDKRWHS